MQKSIYDTFLVLLFKELGVMGVNKEKMSLTEIADKLEIPEQKARQVIRKSFNNLVDNLLPLYKDDLFELIVDVSKYLECDEKEFYDNLNIEFKNMIRKIALKKFDKKIEHYGKTGLKANFDNLTDFMDEL